MSHFGQSPEGSSQAKLMKFVTGALAVLAAVAGLIANIDKIQDFFRPSLSGEWRLTVTINQSSFRAYEGRSATYRIFVTHTGTTLSGTGEKVMVDAKEIPVPARQPIEFTGDIAGDVVTARYVLKPGTDGAARETRGQFVWKIIRGGILSRQAIRLEGTFTGTAASTSGVALAVRP